MLKFIYKYGNKHFYRSTGEEKDEQMLAEKIAKGENAILLTGQPSIPFTDAWLRAFEIRGIGRSSIYRAALTMAKEMMQTKKITTLMRSNHVFMDWYNARLAIAKES